MDKKLRKFFAEPGTNSRGTANYTIVSPTLSTSNCCFDATGHGTLMRLDGLRLTGFCAASKLFFAASQKAFSGFSELGRTFMRRERRLGFNSIGNSFS